MPVSRRNADLPSDQSSKTAANVLHQRPAPAAGRSL